MSMRGSGVLPGIDGGGDVRVFRTVLLGYICLKRGLVAVFDEYRDFCVLLGDVTRVQCAQRRPRTGITHLSTLYPAFVTMDLIQRQPRLGARR